MVKRLVLLSLLYINMFYNLSYANTDNHLEMSETNSIGGQRDEHECLGPAGYLWDNKIGACIRPWEIQEKDHIQAAQIAAKYYKNVKGLTITNVKYNDRVGCFIIELSLHNKNIIITIEKWNIISIVKFM